MRIFALLNLLLIGIVFYSCEHEPDIKNAPQISYASDVNPIISGNCSQQGCHGVLNPGAFLLVGYDNLIKNGKVVAGNPSGSEIFEAITSANEDDVMPRSPYSRLNDQQISTIYLWILQGAKNN